MSFWSARVETGLAPAEQLRLQASVANVGAATAHGVRVALLSAGQPFLSVTISVGILAAGDQT